MSSIVAQGRTLSAHDVDSIRVLIAEHPDWSRWRLSRELAQYWGWKNAAGELKDMSCRQLLDRLEARALIQLPVRRSPPGSRSRRRRIVVDHDTTPITDPLRDLGELSMCIVPPRDPDEALLRHLLERYHYLSYSYTIGENLRYLVRDARGRVLAVAVWGSAALKVKLRDAWIGWDASTRLQQLPLVVNNTRYLIMPWVQVPHLASHLLGRMTRRVSADWMERYGHPAHLAETFVDQDRYAGTCYKAANWLVLGSTVGRTRRDQFNTIQVPKKRLFVLPLVPLPRMRRLLGVQGSPCPI
jgi:hypothetical protein